MTIVDMLADEVVMNIDVFGKSMTRDLVQDGNSPSVVDVTVNRL